MTEAEFIHILRSSAHLSQTGELKIDGSKISERELYDFIKYAFIDTPENSIDNLNRLAKILDLPIIEDGEVPPMDYVWRGFKVPSFNQTLQSKFNDLIKNKSLK